MNIDDYSYLQLLDLRNRKVAGYALQYLITGQIIRPFYQSESSTLKEPEEFSILFGVDHVEKFLPHDHRIIRGSYIVFQEFMEQRVYQKYGIQIRFVDWSEVSYEQLWNIYHGMVKEVDFEPWLAEFFAGLYREWLDTGNPSIVQPIEETQSIEYITLD
jgi:hypothetical protein